MNSIPAGVRRLVVFRAGDRCEYCGLAQEGVEPPIDSGHSRRGSCSRTTSAAPLIFFSSASIKAIQARECLTLQCMLVFYYLN